MSRAVCMIIPWGGGAWVINCDGGIRCDGDGVGRDSLRGSSSNQAGPGWSARRDCPSHHVPFEAVLHNQKNSLCALSKRNCKLLKFNSRYRVYKVNNCTRNVLGDHVPPSVYLFDSRPVLIGIIEYRGLICLRRRRWGQERAV